MANQDGKETTRKLKRILQFFKVKNTDNELEGKDTEPDLSAPILVKHFSDHELEKMPGVKKDKLKTEKISPRDYLESVTESTKALTKQNKSLYQLNPEIKQAKQIFVSSVISPNDMQTGAVGISCDIPGIPEGVQTKLNEILYSYFNDEIEMGVSLEKWLGEALFESGAQPVLVLPYQNIRNLVAEDDAREQAGLERLDEFDDLYAGLNDLEIELPDNDIKTFAHEAYTSIMSDGVDMGNIKLNVALESVVDKSIKLVKENSSIISMTHDATKIQESKRKAKKKVDKLQEKLDKYFIKFTNTKEQAMLLVDDAPEGDDHPSIIELPSSSVVPIIIPGAPSDHIGYFILIDEWGNPISDETMCNANSAGTYNNIADNKYKNFVATPIMRELSEDQKFKAASTAFGITVQNMLDKTFTNLELEGVKVDKFQSMANCLFYHLLTKQKIGMVFVPASLMAYYAFDFRDDGTGKSMLEDMYYILALRTTLIISKIMASIRNAIDKQTISIELDEQDTNIEQTLDILKNMYIKKNMPKFYNDPDLISRDIVANSLSIVTKNIPGLEHSLEVTTDRTTANSPTADDDLLERLSNMSALGLGVPPSALNLLSEDEYSKSVATNNLFFSNHIRSIQRICNKVNKKFARNVVKFSSYLQKKILNIFEEGDEKDGKSDILNKVYNCIDVTLANPNIVATKAEYEELREFMDMVDSLMDKAFPDELFADGSDNDAKDFMGVIRAQIKATLIRDQVANLGLQGVIQLPSIEEIDFDKIESVHLLIKNLQKGISNLKGVISKDDDSGSSY